MWSLAYQAQAAGAGNKSLTGKQKSADAVEVK